jgi:hypothetical protein
MFVLSREKRVASPVLSTLAGCLLGFLIGERQTNSGSRAVALMKEEEGIDER